MAGIFADIGSGVTRFLFTTVQGVSFYLESVLNCPTFLFKTFLSGSRLRQDLAGKIVRVLSRSLLRVAGGLLDIYQKLFL